ncbi:hypothetical protein SEA_BENCZKOWSKI14_41 [Gordonia phage Benczkowski14]|uniref:Uncharacterized protein n=5 Tax=Demosthenesvirus katyusha TaxID=1982108 RepID=A0A345MCH3_9CAUD|nr:membrane protein [Gordonia phage Kvothe]YP_009603315.1 membrane protein [Gordonia phage Katyusha]AMS03751.1 hypothetical protein SEA_BENCZKOWSKI14_41 [Gordonia phage Benczkowski14]AXH68194.1 hypothetical protein SEA_TEATEALATTE_42 [Gordonia phage Teatealatte]QBP29600.1 hypothetical protein SEA_TREDGE_42 [Gordonia phage Tredge]UJD20679.1 membrane protein [Gordonia phage Niagara]AMS03434.1 hypothetical protein SEA_KATYUSHA_41 [Gordonia phage Katyusha]
MSWSLVFQILIIMAGACFVVDTVLDSVRKFKDKEKKE